MRKYLVTAAIVTLCLGAGAGAYVVHKKRSGVEYDFSSATQRFVDFKSDVVNFRLPHVSSPLDSIKRKIDGVADSIGEAGERLHENIVLRLSAAKHHIGSALSDAGDAVAGAWHGIYDPVDHAFGHVLKSAFTVLDVAEDPSTGRIKSAHSTKMPAGFINAAYDITPPELPPLTLSEIRRRQNEDQAARMNAGLSPSAGTVEPSPWTPDQADLNVEAVLVPRQVTVISSSQDGRIAQIMVDHGDTFKKGDLLIAYDCKGLQAEAEIAKMEQAVTRKRAEGSDKLFKLDIISDLDRIGAQVQDKQAAAKTRLYDAKMQGCEIRAEFDGRVTNRLANPGEYTRTDRVLLEVASNEPLQAQFLLPSKWLRWVNVGAPVTLKLGETEKNYTARILRIHGEVDPVSQSIQVIAQLDPYDDPLLPGMSGKATLNVQSIRDAGIRGYLEATPVSYNR